jgi:predicted O-linked N-acetylglucosamine transferase (SPINDLY family)
VPGNYLLAVPGAEAGEGELALVAGRYCLGDVLGRAPTASTSPAEAAGTVTFGAELVRAELNPRLAMVWGRILQAVPNSVLLLRDSGMFEDPGNVDALVSLFGNAGVAHRIDVVRQAERDEFAASVDVALMPFPAANIPAYAEFLSLGVPVVADRSSHSGADMAAFLTAAGLGEQLVGDDIDAYVAAAIALASDIPALTALRSRMPGAISSVPAYSPKGFARMIEDAVIAALNSSPT